MKLLLLNTREGLKPLTDDDYDEKKKLKIGEIYEVRLVSPDPATTVKAEEKTVVKAEDKKVAENKTADKTVKAETEKTNTMTGTVTKTDKGTTITLNNGKCKAFLPNGSRCTRNAIKDGLCRMHIHQPRQPKSKLKALDRRHTSKKND